ncbi:MAG: hypothetical protein IJP07_01150 [Firmicutes bacterium]|nr:hypothetical protein [Bacillota bacterium]
MLLLLLAILLFWLLSMAYYSLLTKIHGEEFKNSEEYNSLICAEDFRVLRCNEREAKVYYYSSFSGNIFYFEKDGEDWVYAGCETLWSSMGSADDYIWPYWWHSLFVRDWR